MFRLLITLLAVSLAVAFVPARYGRVQMSMNMESVQSKLSKAIGVFGLGVALMGPPPAALADGAVSASTVYRARNTYGRRILDLKEAAAKGDFAAFENKKAINSFDLFISGSNGLKSTKSKELKKAETALEAEIYAAVTAKDSGKLRAKYDEFIKVADLESKFKPGEKGQTDSSGYSPSWGTPGQYIYQR